MTTERLASTIERVTVFRSRAVVERRAALPSELAQAPTGGVTLAVGPLPLALDDTSVRVAIMGASDLAATDVSVALVVPPLGASIEAPAEVEIRAAQREVERLVARAARIDKELSHVGSLRFSLAEPRPRRAPRPAPLAAWRELDPWARGKKRRLVEERVALDQALVLAREHVQTLEQREREARASRDASGDTVTKEVRLTLRGAGPVPAGASLVVSYVILGALWAPTYVLRIARDGRRATLSVRAHVVQATGEPWERVTLALSTAKLGRETDLPELASLRIGRRQPPRPSGWRPPAQGRDALFGALDQALAALPSPRALAARPPELSALIMEAESHPETRAAPKKKSAKPPPRDLPRAAAPPPAPPMPEPIPAPAPARLARPAEPPEELMMASMGPQATGMMIAPKARAARAKAEPAAPARGGGRSDELDMLMEEPAPLVPDLTVAPPSLRPAREVLRYGELVMRRWDEPERGRVVPPSGGVDPRVLEARQRAMAVSSAPWPEGTSGIAADAFDYLYRAEGLVDVPGDGRFHNVPLLAREAPIQSTLVIVPRESADAVRVATLQNPLKVPLLAGPADVYWGDELLVTAPVRTTPPGGELRVGLGLEERVKVARNVHYAEETKGLLSSTAHLRHEVRIDVGSRLPDPIRVEVRERVPLRDEAEKEDLDVSVTRVEPPWEDYDQTEHAPTPLRGGKRWRFELAPGEDRRLTYAYAIKIGGKHELVGGNRRE